MPAQIRSFEDPDPLETGIYLDTSILIFHLGSSTRWHRPSRTKATLSGRFLERCAREDVIIAISLQTLLELRNWVFVGIYSDVANSRGFATYKDAYAQHPEHMADVLNEIERIEAVTLRVPNLILIETPLDVRILQRSSGFLHLHQLEPTDALHFSVAYLEGLRAFATVDEAWHRVPDIVLYTCSPRLLGMH